MPTSRLLTTPPAPLVSAFARNVSRASPRASPTHTLPPPTTGSTNVYVLFSEKHVVAIAAIGNDDAAAHVNVNHQKIGIANLVLSLSQYFQQSGTKRRAPLQPRANPTEPDDVVVTVLVELTDESILCPRDLTMQEQLVKEFLMQVCEMMLTCLFVGSIEDCPGIGMYGTFLSWERDDAKFEQIFQELRVSALLGEEPASSSHMRNPGGSPRLKILSSWYNNTMNKYNNGSLFKERRNLLDEHNFKTTNYGRRTKEDEWKQSFYICVRYLRANNFCYPPDHGTKCKSEIEKFVANFIKKSRTRVDSGDEGNWKVEMLNSINFVWDWREEYPDLVDHNHPSKPLKKGKVVRKVF